MAIKKENSKKVNLNEKELKKIRDKHEQESLLFGAEALLPQPSVDRELEKFQLRNGTISSLKEVKDLIMGLARDCKPMFPIEKPFFKLMFKLNGWDHLNPNDYCKPPACAKYIKQYIYGRFDREVLPTLLAKENPIINGYIKKYKLYQFLNDDGLVLLEGYIWDAINVMKESKDWYDFELTYGTRYNLPVQLKMISKEAN